MKKRPAFVGFLSWLVIISGALQIIAGIFLFIHRNDSDVIDSFDIGSGSVTTLAILGIAFGVLWLFVGMGLRSGNNAARLFVVGLVAVEIGFLVWAFIQAHHVYWDTAMWATVIHALVAGYLLFDDDAQSYFRHA
jgi:hypothetical protein